MSILVLLDAQIQPDKIADMKSSLEQMLPETRGYDGCQGIDAHFNVNEPGNMVVVEQWESRSHHEKYLQWRTETGVMAKPESTEGGRRVSVLKQQEGAPVLLG